MQEPKEPSCRHQAAKATQHDHGSLTSQGNSMRGSSTWVIQDCNIGRKYHGGALALRGKRGGKMILAFHNHTYHGLRTEGPFFCRVQTLICTHVPYEVDSYMGAASYVPWFGWPASNAEICHANRICLANRKCVLENFRRTAAEQWNICPVLGTNTGTSSWDC